LQALPLSAFHPNACRPAESQALATQQFVASEYTHSPLAEQLSLERVRSLELDLFADPLGGARKASESEIGATGAER